LRRPPNLTTALLAAAGLVLSAGGAAAQSAGAPAGEARGLRYLSWPGRSEAAPAAPASGPAAPAAGRRDLRRPNTVIPHGGFSAAPPASPRAGLTAAPGARRTLTPANAWMQPAPPVPEPAPAAPPTPRPAPAPAPPPAPAPRPRATPDYLPDPGGRGQAVPAEMIYAPAPGSAGAPAAPDGPVDPMAPRRDAPIFRMQQDAPAPSPAAAPPVPQPVAASSAAAPQPRRVAEVSNSGERPPAQGGRYYSVHRQNGRQPDALEMPAPNYVDALVVTMPETIASQDLAAPEQGPTLIRDAQGRIRPAPAASDGDHQ